MRLLHLTAKNFMSYPTLDIDFANAGVVLITGDNKDAKSFSSNGSGKSTILEAVVFGLFEKTIRGITKNDVISKNQHFMILELTFEQDGKTYTIKRYRGHVVYGNSSFIKQGERDITPKSASDTNAFIEKLIGVDYKTAMSFLVYSINSFNWADASDAELKAAFEKLFDLSVYSECLNFTKERIKLLQADVDKAEATFKGLKEKISLTKTVILDYEAQIKKWDKDQQRDIAQIQTTLSKADSDLAEYTKSVNEINQAFIKEIGCDKGNVSNNYARCKEMYEEKNFSYDIGISDLTDDVNSLNVSITSLVATIDNLKSKLNNNNKIQVGYEEQIKTLRKTEIKDDKCPLCGNVINQDKKEKHTKELETKIAKLEAKIAKVDEETTAYLDQLEKAQFDLQQQRQKLSDSNKKLAELTSQRIPTKWIEDSYTNLLYYSNRIQSTMNMQTHCKNQLETLEKKTNPFINTLETHKQSLVKMQEEAKKLEAELKVKQEELEKYKPWLTAFGNKGIKSIISSKMIPALNKQVNKYLTILTNGEIEAIFSNTTELKSGETSDRFSLKIVSKGSRNYRSCSEGEKKRINVAICFAINDVITMSSKCQCNVVFFDEVLDAIDNRGVESIIGMIQSITNKDGIFVISHNNELQQYFDKVWVVEKQKGNSRLIT